MSENIPKEFVQFIGKEMVLAHGHRVAAPLRMRKMSKPEVSRDYIMEHLVVPVEE